jgi:predicted nucleic acid-binding protein
LLSVASMSATVKENAAKRPTKPAASGSLGSTYSTMSLAWPVGDLMLCEVLQGLESERAAREVEALLRRFEIVPMAGDAIAVGAARNFRSLRRRGITIRKTVDPLIGTWCIENRRPLLHNDGDFRPMARHLGLIELPVAA